MLSNMLNDLAEAMKALDGKKANHALHTIATLLTSALFAFCLGLSNKPPATCTQQLVLILNSMVVCLLTMKVMLPLLPRTTGGLMTLQDTKRA